MGFESVYEREGTDLLHDCLPLQFGLLSLTD